MMMLLDLDPNVVKPGWTPLLITIGLALVMVLLYRSMRRQFRRVDAHFPEGPAVSGAARESRGQEPTAVDRIILDDPAADRDRDERTRPR